MFVILRGCVSTFSLAHIRLFVSEAMALWRYTNIIIVITAVSLSRLFKIPQKDQGFETETVTMAPRS